MEPKKIQFEGHNYLIVHLYSEHQYGYRAHYLVFTNNQKYAASIAQELCGYGNVDSESLHNMKYKRNPTMENALRPYCNTKFVEDNIFDGYCDDPNFPVDKGSYYQVDYREPYDD